MFPKVLGVLFFRTGQECRRLRTLASSRRRPGSPWSTPLTNRQDRGWGHKAQRRQSSFVLHRGNGTSGGQVDGALFGWLARNFGMRVTRRRIGVFGPGSCHAALQVRGANVPRRERAPASLLAVDDTRQPLLTPTSDQMSHTARIRSGARVDGPHPWVPGFLLLPRESCALPKEENR